jgi:hypothetical protein
MKINKSIEILQDLLGEGPHYPPDDRRDAVKQGIEALNRLNYMRSFNIPQAVMPLPSERPIEDFAPSADRKRRLRESPLGKEPK